MFQPGDTRRLAPVEIGAQYKATHKASVMSILGDETPKVSSKGSSFFNMDRWTSIRLTKILCTWASKNPNSVPTLRDIEGWVRETNTLVVPQDKREIVIAATPNVLPYNVAMALVGGAYHEALHTKYSCRRDLEAQEVFDIVMPHWTRHKDWSSKVKALLSWTNIIEDIRIERLGVQVYPGIRLKLHDLQDFILTQEEKSEVPMRKQGKKPKSLRVVTGAFRDYGLGYDSEKQQLALLQYAADNPKAVALVLSGPLAPLLDQAIHLSEDDVLGNLRIAMDVIATLGEISKKEPEPEPKEPEPKEEEEEKDDPKEPDEPEDEPKDEPEPEPDEPEPEDIPKPEEPGDEPEPEDEDEGGDPEPEDSGDEGEPKPEDEPEGESEDEGKSEGEAEDSESESEGESESEPEGESESEPEDESESGEEPESEPEEGAEKPADEPEDGEPEDGEPESDDTGDSGDDSDEASGGAESDDPEDQEDAESGGQGQEPEDSEGEPEEGSEDDVNSEGSAEDDDFDSDDDDDEDDNLRGNPVDFTQEGPEDTQNPENPLGLEDPEGVPNFSGGPGDPPEDTFTDWTNLAQELLDQDETGLKDLHEALEEAIAQGIEKENIVEEGEAPWRPYDTSEDVVAVVKPSPKGIDADKENAKVILQSVKAEAAFLRSRLRTMVLAREMVGISRGVPKGKTLSSRYLVNTVAAIRAGEKPLRAFDRKDEDQALSLSCAIVLDQSVSMRLLRRDATRIIMALTEPLDALNFPTLVLGFRDGAHYFPVDPNEVGQYHRNYSINYDIFKGFNERFHTVQWRFANTKAEHSTPMADGIQFGLNALSFRTEAHRILFVVTDGEPNIEHAPVINLQIRLAKEAGVLVIGVGIGSSAAYVKTTFKDHVWSLTTAEFPKLLMAKLNEIVDKTAHKRGRQIQDTSI